MSMRCPHCHESDPDRVPSGFYCRRVGERLRVKDGGPVRDKNCPVTKDTNGQCEVLPEHTVAPTTEIRIGKGGRKIITQR